MHLNMLYNFAIGSTYVHHIVCPPFGPFVLVGVRKSCSSTSKVLRHLENFFTASG
uniref:Uncharacterized protein n=1 Tax=Anguilla anguilla TaxID=7936 RepID=A0A0E9PJE7_ANGAN